MMKDREKLYQIYHTMLSMVLTWALTMAVDHYFGLKVSGILTILFSLLPAVLIYLFDVNKKNTVSYLILLSIFPILLFIFWLKKFNPIDWLNDLIVWCNTYDGSEENYIASNARFLLFAVAFVGTIVFYLLMKKQAAKIILAVIFMAMLIILCLNRVDLNKFVVGICIFYIMTILVEICGFLYSKKVGRKDKRAGILYLAPICFLLAVLSISLPSKPEPIEWKGIKQLYKNVREQIDVWMTDLEYYFSKREGEFAINFTGYDDESGELGNGGRLNKDQKIALNVSGYKGDNPVYLIGSVSDTYTGYSWEKSRQDCISGENDYYLDYVELLYALSRQDADVLQENQFIKRKSVKIVFDKIKTKTCFYPIKSSSINIRGKKNQPLTEFSNIMFPRALGKGTTYQVTSYEMNLQGEAFRQMLRNSDSFSYEAEPAIKKASMKWLKENIFNDDNTDTDIENAAYYDELKERAELIHKQYTKLPDTVPDRVKNLANLITKDYSNTYDKLKAIEAYLNTYVYTLQPGAVPEGEDFADYFLFENKEGYCTSFATAMAVLGRCINIPTRYVEGYVVTYKTKSENNMYQVKNNQAHAWAEAYIDGVGWIPFEATSNFFNVRYTAWAEETDSKAGEFAIDPNTYYRHYTGDLTGMAQEDSGLTLKKDNKSMDVFAGFIIFAMTVLIILLIFTAYYSALKFKYKKAFEKADYSKKMYMIFLRILRLLQREGYVLEDQETIRMLAQRVKDKFLFDKITFMKVANIFMRYRYAQAAVTKEEFELVNIFYTGFENKQRGEHGKIRLLFEEFLFLAKKNGC